MSSTPLIDLLESLNENDEERFNKIIQEIVSMTNFDGFENYCCNIKHNCLECMQEAKSPYFSLHDVSLMNEGDSTRPGRELMFLEIVRQFLLKFPQMASTPREPDNILPLHIAASIGDTNLGNIILTVYPAAVVAQNIKGKTPLHFAAKEGNLPMVNSLLQVNPAAAAVVTEKIKVPLHFAAKEGYTEICRQLLKAFPAGASVRSARGKLPLHVAVKWGYVDTINALLSFFPQGSACVDWESSPPLHIALQKGQYDASKLLMRQCSQALHIRNVDGDLPIDIALRKGYPIDFIAEMIMKWPPGGKLALKNVKDDINIHEWSWEKVELLLRVASNRMRGSKWLSRSQLEHSNPEFSVTSKTGTSTDDLYSDKVLFEQEHTDFQWQESINPRFERSFKTNDCSEFWKNGQLNNINDVPNAIASYPGELHFLPLHAALEVGASARVLRYVIENFPDQIEVMDEFKQLPLHIACANTSESSVLDVLKNEILPSCTHATKSRDVFGRLPIHVALTNRAKYDVVDALLKVNPLSGISICNTNDEHFRGLVPLFLATEMGCDLDVIHCLLSANPSCLIYLKDT